MANIKKNPCSITQSLLDTKSLIGYNRLKVLTSKSSS